MPARKNAPVFCTCAACCRYSGHSKGVAFSSTIERTAHLARVNLERDTINSSAHTQPAEEDIQAASADVFVSTLLDNGPNLDSQPSKLWTSRNEFQQSISTHRLPDASALAIDDLINSVSQLTLSHDVQDPSLSARSATSSRVQDPPTSSECSTICQSLMPSTPPLSPLPSLEKRSCHRNSQRAITLLKNMDLRLSGVKKKLLAPSHVILCEAESEMVAVREALEKVTRRAAPVDHQKQAVIQTLETLQTRITELRNAIPDTRRNPVEFDSSKGSHKFKCSMLTIINCRPSLQISCRRVHLCCTSIHLFGSCFCRHYGSQSTGGRLHHEAHPQGYRARRNKA
jgi:hypothetical protein